MASPMEALNTSVPATAPNTVHLVAAISHGLFGNIAAYTNVWSVFCTLFTVALLYDQISYRIQKGNLVGPAWKMPFIGPFLESVNPKFDKYHEKWLSGSLSCVSVFHKFVIIASTRDVARKVLTSPAYVKPCIVDVAHKLLRPENWVFLDGRDHVDYRKGLNGLFTRQALATYLPGQQEVYHKYFQSFLHESQEARTPKPCVYKLRELMCAVSCRTFVGHYMDDRAVEKIADDYYKLTAALELVNFPIILPFTKAWYGKKASDRVFEVFANCAAKSRIRMKQPGVEPHCILDRWMIEIQASKRYRDRIAKGEAVPAEEKPAHVLRDFTDYEISMTLFTFLYASQDATSSACCWLIQICADRPDVLAKVREEGSRICPANRPVNMEDLEAMEYTRAVVKETLRYRPPVLMIPYVVKKPFPLTDTYTAPKNTMIVPSFYLSLHDPEAYPEPDTFNPERWISGTAEQQGKNWLVFGTGSHYCLGQTYATLNLMLLLHLLSSEYNWEHEITDKSEEIRVFATIFPMDDLLLSFSRRDQAPVVA